ncbi:hypothetical protein CCHR01_10169 [Colletotrichum chrysophilum]|uniref:Uncharacterized protein n=1 Tax=Colletotrichum chrysophilum TaxID=1836956 RepID=A0AAD9EH11_9PEZI|nr:hypothetical protein CCHR01_10169 [Colletotrichum chrysophilum]
MSCSASLGASSPTHTPPCAPPTQVSDHREYGDVFGPKRANWKEAFLFFYWDMKIYRCEEDMKAINAEIQRALRANYKSSNIAALPSSWDYVLNFLVRFLRRLTDCRLWAAGVAPVYDDRRCLVGNPYLVDFENSHNLEGPWRVPLMAEFVLEHDETDGIDDFFREFKDRVSGTASIDFDFTFATKQGYAALVTDPEVPINRCTLNWCKLFYTYLLHWALAMRNNSPGARLYLSLKSLLDNKEAAGDTMAVNRALWQAIVAFNHPVEMQQALTQSDTFQSPTGHPTRPDTKLPAKAEEKRLVYPPPQTQTHLVKLGLWISTNQRIKDKQSICQGHTTSPSARDQEVCTCEGFQLFELLGII